jgi:hypothetical protein
VPPDDLLPETDAELVARYPHLARPGPNWAAQERRQADLLPVPSEAFSRLVWAVLLAEPARLQQILTPIVQRLLHEALASRGLAAPPLPNGQGPSRPAGRDQQPQ